MSDWRCVDCKLVVSSGDEPERCNECGCKSFARITATDPIGTAQERLARYIAEYEDAPYWGGPTRYPDPPSIADLKVIQSRIAEVGRLEAALREIVVASEELGRIDDDGEHWFTTPEARVRELARAALSLQRRPT